MLRFSFFDEYDQELWKILWECTASTYEYWGEFKSYLHFHHQIEGVGKESEPAFILSYSSLLDLAVAACGYLGNLRAMIGSCHSAMRQHRCTNNILISQFFPLQWNRKYFYVFDFVVCFPNLEVLDVSKFNKAAPREWI